MALTPQRVKQAIRTELQAKGYSTTLLDSWPAKATYYKHTGEPMTNLPADPRSMQIYLARGFTLQPPTKRVRLDHAPSVDDAEPEEIPSQANEARPPAKGVYQCPECGYISTAGIGLRSHMRHKHTNKDEQEVSK